MTFLEKLRSAPDSPQAKVNTFLAVFNPEGETVAAFVEGRDDPSFYRQHLEAVAKQHNVKLTLYALNKKREVLNTRDFLSSRFRTNPRILFFVDKDHDDLIPAHEAGQRSKHSL